MATGQQAYPVPPSTGSSGSSTPRFLPIRDVVSILADSASGHYTRHPLLPSCVRLEGRPLGTIADAVANPPTTWTLNNSARLASASASGDSLTMTVVSSGTDIFYNGTATSGYYSRAITRGAGRIGRIVHMAATTISGANTAMRFGIAHSTSHCLATVDILNSAGTIYFRYIVNGTTVSTIATLSSGEAATGLWVWLELDLVSGGLWFRYKKGSYASGEPLASEWVLGLHSGATLSLLDNALTDVMVVSREATNTPPVVVFSGFRAYNDPDQSGYPTSGGLDFTGYASAGDALVVADLDFGTDGALPDIATLRLMCADAVNRLPGDAATWTWSMTGSDSSAPAEATTYQSAASLTLKQPSSDTAQNTACRYWRLRVKAASSSSTQAGSLDLSRIPGVYVAAA